MTVPLVTVFLLWLLWRRAWPDMPAIGLPPALAVAEPLIASIVLSRLYLDAHWLSDVAGELALETAWITSPVPWTL